MNSHSLALYLWIAPHVLLFALLIGLVGKRKVLRFPVFFSYVLLETLQFCVLFVMVQMEAVSVSAYVNTDLVGRAISTAFHFGVIQELFEWPLALYPGLRRSLSRVLNSASLLLVLLAAAVISLVYLNELPKANVPAYVIEQVLDVAQCGLLVAVFVWYSFLHVRMPNQVLGISVGLGLIVGVEPLLYALRYQIASESVTPNIISAGIYHVAVLVWILFTLIPDERVVTHRAQPLPDVGAWNAELGRFSQL